MAQIGCPQAFATFSAADGYWADLEKYLQSYYHKDSLGIPYEELTATEKFKRRVKLLKDNQVLAGVYFVRRLDAMMEHLVKDRHILGGKLTDYVIRYETQGRGSLHVHMLLWYTMEPGAWREVDRVKRPVPPPVLTGDAAEREKFFLEDLAKHGDLEMLHYTNGNIWALGQAEHIRARFARPTEPHTPATMDGDTAEIRYANNVGGQYKYECKIATSLGLMCTTVSTSADATFLRRLGRCEIC